MENSMQTETRLNLGSGPVANRGWDNLDRSPNVFLGRIPGAKTVLRRVGLLNDGHMPPWDEEVIRHDIRQGLPYRSGSVAAIYSSHALEHIYLAEASAVIQECYRVLKAGGLLRLALPDATSFARDLLAGESDGEPDAGRTYNERLLCFPERRPTLRDHLRNLTSGHIHRWQPTPSLVQGLMISAGFIEARLREFKQGDLPDLAQIETRRESFFVEGTVPLDATSTRT